ncbi:MAG TPA: 50S ribosomal protein L22 [Terriglobales bacterium]|nr:50S ribosomal protein L22 [Terriglobales bacterium]
MEFTAQARFTRVSPQKARLVLDMIKGRRVEDALNTLTFANKRIAPTVHKLLRSAIENANYMSQEKGLDVDVDNLYVKNAISNEGPRMKRIRPAPMGRAYRYQRRISHISIVLAERKALDNGSGTEAPAVSAAVSTKGKTAGKAKTKAKKSAAKKTAAKR